MGSNYSTGTDDVAPVTVITTGVHVPPSVAPSFAILFREHVRALRNVLRFPDQEKWTKALFANVTDMGNRFRDKGLSKATAEGWIEALSALDQHLIENARAYVTDPLVTRDVPRRGVEQAFDDLTDWIRVHQFHDSINVRSHLIDFILCVRLFVTQLVNREEMMRQPTRCDVEAEDIGQSLEDAFSAPPVLLGSPFPKGPATFTTLLFLYTEKILDLIEASPDRAGWAQMQVRDAARGLVQWAQRHTAEPSSLMLDPPLPYLGGPGEPMVLEEWGKGLLQGLGLEEKEGIRLLHRYEDALTDYTRFYHAGQVMESDRKLVFSMSKALGTFIDEHVR